MPSEAHIKVSGNFLLLLLLHPKGVFYFPFIIFICLYDRTHYEFLDRAKTIYVLYVQQSIEGRHHVCVAPSCLSDCCSQSRTRTQRRFKSLNAGQTSLHFQVIYQGFFSILSPLPSVCYKSFCSVYTHISVSSLYFWKSTVAFLSQV